MASKAKKYAPEVHFPGKGGGEGGSGVRDMAPPSLGNLGATFSETSLPYLRPTVKFQKLAPPKISSPNS